jgi:hypothetical protein
MRSREKETLRAKSAALTRQDEWTHGRAPLATCEHLSAAAKRGGRVVSSRNLDGQAQLGVSSQVQGVITGAPIPSQTEMGHFQMRLDICTKGARNVSKVIIMETWCNVSCDHYTHIQ